MSEVPRALGLLLAAVALSASGWAQDDAGAQVQVVVADACREDLEVDVPCARDLDDGSLFTVQNTMWSATADGSVSFDNMYPTANYKSKCPDGSPGSPFCQTDNRDLTVFMESSVDSGGRAAIREALDYSFDNSTVLNVGYPASASRSGGSETDIIYQARVPISGFAGRTYCDDAVAERRCDQHYVQFADGVVIQRDIACHETGHAVGLTHGQQANPRQSNSSSTLACMVNGPSYPTDQLGTHNIKTINNTYGG